jgi:hypothetical protein
MASGCWLQPVSGVAVQKSGCGALCVVVGSIVGPMALMLWLDLVI